MKVMSIIGIIFSVVFLMWFGLFAFGDETDVLTSGRISREEFSPIGLIYGLFGLGLSIVCAISTFQKKKNYES